MSVPMWVWLLTVAALLTLVALDLFIVDHKPHEVGIKEASRWVVFYVSCAIVFGIMVWVFAGGAYAGEFYAGYVTEYALSIDNLFVFVIIMAGFGVPKIHQHKVLLIGIVIALIFRSGFIAVGAAVIAKFSWVFYLFGAVLIVTAINLVRGKDEGEEYQENAMIRLMRKVLPVTGEYHDAKSFVRVNGKRMVTPMLMVMIAIGSTDLLFALDSIPAVFGLTQEAYLVFAVNAFALMGLRQLFFLIGGLLERLVYLSVGLSIILAYIGVKLILEALHGNELPFINGGDGLHVPVPGTFLSLGIIMGILAITTVASLAKSRGDSAKLSV